MIINVNGLSDTEKLGEQISGKLKGTEIIAFFGGLGMGKTTLTRSIVKNLGSDDDVSSPTFAIVNEYTAKNLMRIYHFDMYRISSWEDLESTGFFDYIDNGIILIEWSENIENALPENTIKISIKPGKSENSRVFEIEGLDI